jgi:hypothetical protein
MQNEEPKFTTISDVLSFLQKSVKCKKTKRNEFGKYNFRNAEQILEEAKAHLPFGAFITVNEDILLIGDRFYVKSTATLGFNKDQINVSAYAREPENKKGMDVSQITGSASSYARKYALGGLLAIDDGSDADSQDNSNEKEYKTLTESQQKEIMALIENHVVDFDKLLSAYKVKALDEIDARYFEKLKAQISAKPLKEGLENE